MLCKEIGNCKTKPIENKTATEGDADMRFVNFHGLMSPFIQSELRKSESWNELKREFTGIGIPDRTIDSFALIPLVETALDDGAVSHDEKEKILLVMKNLRLMTFGIDPVLHDLWSQFKGRTEFLIVWTVYLRDVSRQMTAEEKMTLKALIIEACRFMIRTIGGFLKISNLENRMAIAIESAFSFETNSIPVRQ
jgi:hypothetical protein